jgi:hypothetical protein
MISRPVYLIFPAYIVGVASMFACLNILPYDVGVSIAAVLLLVMLTPATLLHPRIDDGSLGPHLLVYGACLAAAVSFAFFAIPEKPAPYSFSEGSTWVSVAFIVTQQVFYFALHAFRKASD